MTSKYHNDEEWPYHEDKHGNMVPCASNPCRRHPADIMATSPEDAVFKKYGTNNAKLDRNKQSNNVVTVKPNPNDFISERMNARRLRPDASAPSVAEAAEVFNYMYAPGATDQHCDNSILMMDGSEVNYSAPINYVIYEEHRLSWKNSNDDQQGGHLLTITTAYKGHYIPEHPQSSNPSHLYIQSVYMSNDVIRDVYKGRGGDSLTQIMDTYESRDRDSNGERDEFGKASSNAVNALLADRGNDILNNGWMDEDGDSYDEPNDIAWYLRKFNDISAAEVGTGDKYKVDSFPPSGADYSTMSRYDDSYDFDDNDDSYDFDDNDPWLNFND